MTDRSIYLYDPRIPAEREVRRKLDELIEAQRGTCAQKRYFDVWILTCRCGALTVTQAWDAPRGFRDDHAECRKEQADANAG